MGALPLCVQQAVTVNGQLRASPNGKEGRMFFKLLWLQGNFSKHSWAVASTKGVF